jgi:succinyl-CoA synthetase alpha subunit
MRLSNSIAELEGVQQAAVVMGTPINKDLLKNLDLLLDDAEKASPNDLVIALDAEDDATIDAALLEVDRLLVARETSEEGEVFPKTLDSAIRVMPNANLTMISVPGEFAAREATKAVRKGLNVFLFSSNVAVEDEVKLKQLALKKGLLVMGPDCGTAIINNIVLGFGNIVRRGTIGIVSAAGTGLQQVSTIIHSEGFGISQAIGTGGNDLSKAVGGLMMIEGIKRLAEDKATEAIVLISKPPDKEVSDRVLDAAKRSNKPIVVNFLGGSPEEIEGHGGVSAATLEDAAKVVCNAMRKKQPSRTIFTAEKEEVAKLAETESKGFTANQRFIRGLYTGGTLCSEALVILSPILGPIHSNSPLDSKYMLEDSGMSKDHTFVDMGSEEFTLGRPHPMIDYTLRKQRIIREAANPETAVILLDVVIGFGSHDDPAGELIPPIMKARAAAEGEGRRLSFVASIVGTDLDHQDLRDQQKRLEDAGVIVMPSNAQAARLAALIATRGAAKDKLFEEGV